MMQSLIDFWFRTVLRYRTIAVWPDGTKHWFMYCNDAKWHSPKGSVFVHRDKRHLT